MRIATVVLALLLSAPAPVRAAETRAFVLGSDYITGSLSSADLSPRTPHCDVASVGSDAAMRWWNGRLYVVNRYGGDNVQVIDPASGATLQQFSVGAGSNPHDIAFASATKAYVTRFDSLTLWIVNPATGAHTGTIPLAAFADADGNPEMDRMAMVGPLLFVSLERVNRNDGYLPEDTSWVAVIDTRADTLVDCDPARPGVQAIPLQLRNPFTAFQFDHATSRLLIGCSGRFGTRDGGVEWIDPVRLRSGGVAVLESTLGGDVDAIAWGDAATSWAVVADSLGETRLVSWSAASGTRLATIWDPGGYALTDVAANDRGEVWASNGSGASPRVRVFSAATGLQVGADVVCTLPPLAVVFDGAGTQVAGVPPEPTAAARLRLAPPAPNPARRGTRLAFTLAGGATLRVEVFDAAGRRVRALVDGWWPAGTGTLAWDLADDAGTRVPAGLYFVRLRTGGDEARARLLVLP